MFHDHVGIVLFVGDVPLTVGGDGDVRSTTIMRVPLPDQFPAPFIAWTYSVYTASIRGVAGVYEVMEVSINVHPAGNSLSN